MVKRGIQAYACPGVNGSDLSGVDDSVLVTITVTENWVGSKKGFKAKKGDPDSQGHRYLGFNWPQEGQHFQHRYRIPIPETAEVGEVLTLPVNTAEPFTERDFMDEMYDDLKSHPAKLTDPRVWLSVILYMGPLILLTISCYWFVIDVGFRSQAVQGDMFGVTRSGYTRATLNGTDSIENSRRTGVYDDWGMNRRDEFERKFADPPTKPGEMNSWQVDYGFGCGQLSIYDSEVASDDARKVRNAQGATLWTLGEQQATGDVHGTFCLGHTPTIILMIALPFLMIGGFFRLTFGWRRDLKLYVRQVLHREMSEAAKAVQRDEAGEKAGDIDKYGLKTFTDNNYSYYHPGAGVLRKEREFARSRHVNQGHGKQRCFAFHKLVYRIKTSPEENILYTEAIEIFLALYSLYKHSLLRLDQTWSADLVLIVCFAQCIIMPVLLISPKHEVSVIAAQVTDMTVDFFYAAMAFIRNYQLQTARRACLAELWEPHPCNHIFQEYTSFNVLFTFYACTIPPFLFSRKILTAHTHLTWEHFKYFFDRTSKTQVGIQDRELDQMLHFSARNIILLPGPRRDAFLRRVKIIYSVGLLGTFGMFWYLLITHESESRICQDSDSFSRVIPSNIPTAIATCEKYHDEGTIKFGYDSFNATVCSHNYVLLQHNALTFRKMCPETCRACGNMESSEDELAANVFSALISTAVFGVVIALVTFLARSTACGTAIEAYITRYEGDEDAVELWKFAHEKTEGALQNELAAGELDEKELSQVPVLAGWGYNTPEQQGSAEQQGMCVLGAAEPGRLAAVLQASEAERLLTAAVAAADTAASHSM